MGRISQNKKKPRVSTDKMIYFAAIIAVTVTIFLISINYIEEDKSQVTIKNIDFEHVGSDVYVKFYIKNPKDEQKTCLLNMMVADKEYRGYVNISAKSKKSYKTLVDMPKGRTEVRLDYNCS
ncbi:MAG: hypothetical protein ACFFG0_11670 [Candidatus Thorarchaeota archaeon]